MTAILITLVRHGKVAGPAALYGRTDIELSAEGCEDLLRSLRSIHTQSPIDHLVSSPRLRCLQSAREFSTQYEIPLCIENNFQEMDFGDWDGIAFDELGDEWKNIEAFWHSPHTMQPPKGETLADFAARIISAWESFLRNAKPGHNLILCHGGVIRIVIAHLLNLDWRNAALFKQLQIGYASHTRIEIGAHENSQAIIRWIAAPANIQATY